MLVLSRGKGQEIVIGKDIRIVVVQVRGGRARIAIDAPKTLSIKRGEIKDRR